MKEKQVEQFYVTPLMKVVEIKARQVLCQSPTGTLGFINKTEEEDW